MRDEANRRRLWEALRRGLVDSIASDHSPCPPQYKAGPSPFAGVSGVQTTLSVLLNSVGLSLAEVNRLRTAAARLFGLRRKGILATGYDADLVLVDLDSTWTVTNDTLRCRHARSPFMGETMRGVVVATLLRGAVVYQSGRPAAEPAGEFLRPMPAGRSAQPIEVTS
jgi:allantoinase